MYQVIEIESTEVFRNRLYYDLDIANESFQECLDAIPTGVKELTDDFNAIAKMPYGQSEAKLLRWACNKEYSLYLTEIFPQEYV